MKLKLTGQEARDIVWDYNPYWEAVKGTVQTVDNDRWTVTKEGIFKSILTGKYFIFYWSVGATECQDEKPYEYDNEVEVEEVEYKEVKKMEWVVKE